MRGLAAMPTSDPIETHWCFLELIETLMNFDTLTFGIFVFTFLLISQQYYGNKTSEMQRN